MSWKSLVKKSLPPSVLNGTLLAFPFLYRTKVVNYETNLPPEGVADLLSQLDLTLGLSGDVVECGCSRCGGTVIMAGHMRKKGIAKRIYACDSFEGFDPTELRREKDSGLTDTPDDAFTSTSLHYVRAKIAKLGFSDVIQPVQGFFQNTLPHLDVSICMALVDCDLQDSLVYAAEALWPRIVAGGRLLFDDYTSTEYQGAKKGVDLFTKKYAGEIQSHGLLNQLYFVHKK